MFYMQILCGTLNIIRKYVAPIQNAYRYIRSFSETTIGIYDYYKNIIDFNFRSAALNGVNDSLDNDWRFPVVLRNILEIAIKLERLLSKSVAHVGHCNLIYNIYICWTGVEYKYTRPLLTLNIKLV